MSSNSIAPVREPITLEGKLAHWESILANGLEWMNAAVAARDAKGTEAMSRVCVAAQAEIERLKDRHEGVRGGGALSVFEFANPVKINAD